MNKELAEKLRQRKKETQIPMSVIVRNALKEELGVEDDE
jgi:hypothetical protein